MHARTKSLQSCLTLCHSMDCSPPGSSVNGILQARILEWVAISSSRGSSWTMDWSHTACDSCISDGIFTAEPQYSSGPRKLFELMNINFLLIKCYSFNRINPNISINLFLLHFSRQAGMYVLPLWKNYWKPYGQTLRNSWFSCTAHWAEKTFPFKDRGLRRKAEGRQRKGKSEGKRWERWGEERTGTRKGRGREEEGEVKAKAIILFWLNWWAKHFPKH